MDDCSSRRFLQGSRLSINDERNNWNYARDREDLYGDCDEDLLCSHTSKDPHALVVGSGKST